MPNATSQLDEYYQGAISASSTLANALGVLGNSWVLSTFIKFKQIRKLECLDLIASLAFTDLLNSLGGVIYNVGQFLTSIAVISSYNKGFCLLLGSLTMFGIVSGQLTTLSIAFDRFFLFYSPVKYFKQDHRKYALRSLSISLLSAFVVVLFMFVGVDLASQPSYCSVGGCMSRLFAVLYMLLIFSVIFAVLLFYMASLILKRRTKPAGSMNQEEKMKRQLKATKTISLVLLFYVLFWVVPNVAALAAIVAKLPTELRAKVTAFISLGGALNCAVNTFIYASKHSTMRGYMFAVVKKVQVQPLSQARAVPKSAKHNNVKC